MDEADRGNDEAQAFLEAAIAAARGIQPAAKESQSHCWDCGREIDSRRQLAVRGCTLCTPCAEKLESRKARGLI